MENQHQKITGYRDLSQSEIDLMNRIKAQASECGDLVLELRNEGSTDARWVSIAQTHLQQGYMALVRSVARPESF